MTGGVVVIGWPQLALATGFIIFVGAVSLRLALGVERDLAIGTARTYAQLLMLGLVLRWVFTTGSPWLVLGILVLMIGVAVSIIGRRLPDKPPGIMLPAFVALLTTGLAVTFSVTGLVVGVDPWFEPRYVIPIAGMVVGNSMNGMALALERCFADMDSRSDEILTLTAMGATPWEAALPSIRTAMRAGLIPGINTLTAAGIVFIPGMMAGQIIAGVDPFVAAPYQIVVMLMIAAADVMGSAIAVTLAYRKRFSADGVYLGKGLRGHS